MRVLLPNQYSVLTDFMRTIRAELADWLLVEVRVLKEAQETISGPAVAEILQGLYPGNPGIICICNAAEVLMLIHWKKDGDLLVQQVRTNLPDNSCAVEAVPSTLDGMSKLQIKITPSMQATDLYKKRSERKRPVFLVADDDMFQREIVVRGLSKLGSVFETGNGDEVKKLYCEHNPDILFLDIHMPGRSGRDLIYDISMIDAEAYVVMISADGSHDNVADTWQKGAREFLTKPFTKERLIECARQCPTVRSDA